MPQTKQRSAGRGTALKSAPHRASTDPLTEDDRRALLHAMELMRSIEDHGSRLYKKGKIPGSFYDGRGQEAISVGAAFALAPADPICSPLSP